MYHAAEGGPTSQRGDVRRGVGRPAGGRPPPPALDDRHRRLRGDPPGAPRNVLVEQSWVLEPMQKLQQAFQQSLREHPPIAPGTPD